MSMADQDRIVDKNAVVQMAERFCKELQALGGAGYVADNAEQTAQVVSDCLAKWQIDTVVTSNDVSSTFPTLVQAISATGVATSVWATDIREPRDMAAIQAGLVVADWAIAATGTLALAAAPGKGRSLSLLPPALMVLVPASCLVATRSEMFAKLHKQARQGEGQVATFSSALSFITGPSRTADIESDLSIGVHGPGRVVAVVVMDS